jgi:hypothetical protein
MPKLSVAVLASLFSLFASMASADIITYHWTIDLQTPELYVTDGESGIADLTVTVALTGWTTTPSDSAGVVNKTVHAYLEGVPITVMSKVLLGTTTAATAEWHVPISYGPSAGPIFVYGSPGISEAVFKASIPETEQFDQDFITLHVSAAPVVPEPASLLLLGTGLAGAIRSIRRRAR